MTKSQKIIYYILLVLISVGFIFSGISKVTGNAMAIAGFAQAHLPIWFMYFIGYAEIAGAIGLWIPKLSRYAIYGLGIILAGAIVTTIIFVSVPMAILPAVFAIILGIIYWLGGKKASMAPTQTPIA